MGDVVARSTQPALAAIKLAWWRERLEELDQGKVPAEPRLQAAAKELLPRHVTGHELAEIEAGWATLLQEQPETDVAIQRGANLFKLAARLLGSEFWQGLDVAGGAYAAGGLVRRGFRLNLVASADDGEKGQFLPSAPTRLRSLTALVALAVRDLERRDATIEREATPGRAWTLLRHRITGNY